MNLINLGVRVIYFTFFYVLLESLIKLALVTRKHFFKKNKKEFFAKQELKKKRIIRQISRSEHQEICSLVSRGFQNDAMYKHVCEDYEARKRFIRTQTDIVLDETVYGYVIEDENRNIAATSIWSYSKDKMSPIMMIRLLYCFLRDLPFSKYSAFGDFAKSEKEIEAIMKDQTEKGYFTLNIISCDPFAKGKGYGSNLMNHFLSFVDKEKKAVVLTTTSQENIKFYSKFNFKLVKTLNVGFSVHIMRRDSQKL